ncbi:MAG: hypothetical protein ACXU8S_08580 [Phenylobacterium sp.]
MNDLAAGPARGAPQAPSISDRDWLVARIGGGFFLDTATAVSDVFDGDLTSGLILLAILRQNLSKTPGAPAEDESDRRISARSVARRRPATAYGVAKTLGLNYETTRRHIHKLTDEGYCIRAPEGFYANVEVLERAEITRTLRRIVGNMSRLASRMRAAGLMDL